MLAANGTVLTVTGMVLTALGIAQTAMVLGMSLNGVRVDGTIPVVKETGAEAPGTSLTRPERALALQRKTTTIAAKQAEVRQAKSRWTRFRRFDLVA